MKYHMFSVFDHKVNAFNTPFALPDKTLGIRGFIQACKDPNSDFAKYPADYSFFYIGEFDDELGAMIPCLPDNLGMASSYVRPSVEVTENAS